MILVILSKYLNKCRAYWASIQWQMPARCHSNLSRISEIIIRFWQILYFPIDQNSSSSHLLLTLMHVRQTLQPVSQQIVVDTRTEKELTGPFYKRNTAYWDNSRFYRIKIQGLIFWSIVVLNLLESQGLLSINSPGQLPKATHCLWHSPLPKLTTRKRKSADDSLSNCMTRHDTILKTEITSSEGKAHG